MFQLDQYVALRQRAGSADLGGRGRVVLRGRDRLTFLHALLTNDIAALAPGTGCYAALLTAQGRMVTDMLVLEMGDVTLLDVPRAAKDALLAKLDQLIFSEDVQLGDLSDAWTALAVHGPLAPTALAAALAGVGAGTDPGAGLDAWRPFQNTRLVAGEEPIVVARVDDLGLPGFRLYASPGLAARLRAALTAAGAVAVDPAAVETVRIEAGVPEFGADLTEETIPLEAGIEARAISFTKGCYPGQEVIVRIVQRGHGRVVRKLAGLRVAGGIVPAPGDELAAGDKAIGFVTSACHSPMVGGPIALGYLHRDFLEPGTSVTIVHEGGPLAATVSVLPFALGGQ